MFLLRRHVYTMMLFLCSKDLYISCLFQTNQVISTFFLKYAMYIKKCSCYDSVSFRFLIQKINTEKKSCTTLKSLIIHDNKLFLPDEQKFGKLIIS